MVSNVRNDLVNLVQLQQVYDSIARLIAERNSPPVEIRELQEANRLRHEELEELERQMEAHREEIKEVSKKEDEWKLELKHFQKQKSTVTNEREFTAVISEIDYATRAIEESAARRKELEESIAELEQEVISRRDARPEEESAHSDVVTSWDQRKDELVKEVHALATRAKKLEAEIQPKLCAQFLRLLKSKHGTAISEVVDESCSLCHLALRPHLQQRVRRCEEIIDCEYCHRILYVNEIMTQVEDGAADG
jgi:predicted  nucleic acid-binding Zn-ribbon protein